MAPSEPDAIATSRAGVLLSLLPVPEKPDLFLEDVDSELPDFQDGAKEVISIKSDSFLLKGDFEKLKSPRNSFFEDFSALIISGPGPMKPDRLTHDDYVRELEARLQEVHRAPKKLARAVKWRRRLDFEFE